VLMRNIYISLVILVFAIASLAATDYFRALDRPSDDGKAIDLNWNLSGSNNSVSLFKTDSLGTWSRIAEFKSSETSYTDAENVEPGIVQKYMLVAGKTASSDSTRMFATGIATEQWFNARKLPLMIFLLAICLAVIYYIVSARRGKELFIRRINGLESMDEAVGRATEKGRPILFVPGIGDLDDIQTIAGLTILSQLAYKAATYNAELLVPVSKSMVMSTAREIVKEAFLKAGRSDAFKEESVFYLTDDQFGYVAGIDGIMVREQPAANFFLGTFYAESLILAETGFGTGAMQTAGTAQPSQLPFFVVSCDYTLIGEELFAASAYLSKEPNQLGSLKGQDLGKLIIVLMIIIGCLMEIAGFHWFKNMLIVE
jgi:hypothetical protein